MSERPNLTKRVKLNGPHQIAHKHCGYCGMEISSSWCATGSVIEGLQSFIVKDTIRIGLDFVETQKKVSFVKRMKCFLCDKCISEYRCVEIKGTLHELVKVDFRPPGQMYLPEREFIPESGPDQGTVIKRSVHG